MEAEILTAGARRPSREFTMKWHRKAGWSALAAMATLLLFPVAVAAIGFASLARDAFPVFDNPAMLTAEEAEASQAIFPRDAVIGVSHGSEAKAYPITVMGYHELGNDTIDGIPIAVAW